MSISRRAFLQAVGATAVTLPGALHAISPEERRLPQNATECTATGKKPNVILILCDDLGWGDLGEFWQNSRTDAKPKITTPRIDEAMQDGVMLTHAYTTAPVCAPARASMVTGKNQGHCSLRDNSFDRPIDAHMTIGTVMKQAGYDTWHLGKWGIGGGYATESNNRIAMACDAGFDYSYGYPAHNHGHSYYHCEGAGMSSNSGSPIVENVSATAYMTGRYADLSTGVTGENGIFAQDTDATGSTYYRRLIANSEVQYCYDTDLFTAKLKQLIDQQLTRNAEAKKSDSSAKDTPFFAYACYTTVHGTYNASLGCTDTSLNDRTHMHVPPEGINYPALDETDTTWGGGVTFEKNKGELAFKGTAATANKYIHSDYTEAKGYNTWGRRRYATAIRRLDDAIGDLRHFLQVRGIAENTLIIFTSDNGPADEALGTTGFNWIDAKTDGFDSNGPYYGYKRFINEGGVREPTFAVWPGTIPASTEKTTAGTVIPRKSNHPFQFPAWMATLADVAGLPQPAHCDGVSILPTLTQNGTQLPARIYGEYVAASGQASKGFEQMVRDGDYVLLRNSGGSDDGLVELYNVVLDPGQTTNLVSLPSEQNRLRWMSNLLTTCRMPDNAMQDADLTCHVTGHTARTNANNKAFPSIAQAGTLPDWEVRVYNDTMYNADAEEGKKGGWPWVPNFRTMYPNSAFLAGDMATVKEKVAKTGAYGLAIRGWIDVSATGDVTFTSTGAGGCQLWIHEAHALEWEAGDCTSGKSVTLNLAKGRHPFRLYLTTTDGTGGLCSLTMTGASGITVDWEKASV